MRKFVFITTCLLSLIACKWDLDKFDLDGNVYDCEETCVNGSCDDLTNECICNDGWIGERCDIEEITFEKTIQLPEIYSNGIYERYEKVSFIDLAIENGYIIKGSKTNSAVSKTFIAKLDLNGEFVWENSSEKYEYSGESILKFNNSYFIGIENGFVQLDLNGEIIFEKNYDVEFIEYISITKDNQLLLTGIKSGNIWLSKTRINGNLIWEKNFGNQYDDVINDVLIDEDCIFIVSSLSWNETGNSYGYQDGLLYKTDLEGNLLWSKNYGGSNIDYIDKIIKNNNNYLLIGYSSSEDYSLNNNYGLADAWIFECNTDGEIKWSKNYGGRSTDAFNSIHITNENNFVLGGSTNSSSFDVNNNYGQIDFWLVKIDPLGNIIWEKTYGTPNTEWLRDMTISLDNGFILFGDQIFRDIYLIKTDANGNI